MAPRSRSAFTAMPTTTKVLLLLVVFLVTGVAYYFLLFGPRADDIETADKKHTQLQADVREAERRRQEFLRLSEELAAREPTDRLNNQILPEKAEIAAFLQDLNRTAELAGLTMLLVEPRPEETEELYVRIPVSLRLEGRYHQLAKFFYNVSRVDRAINMENISLTLAKRKQSKQGELEDDGDAYRLNVDVLATTFRRHEAQAAGANAQAGKGKVRRSGTGGRK